MNLDNQTNNLQTPINGFTDAGVNPISPQSNSLGTLSQASGISADAQVEPSPSSNPTPQVEQTEKNKLNFLKKHPTQDSTSMADPKKSLFSLGNATVQKYVINFIVPLVSIGISILLILVVILPFINNREKVNSEFVAIENLKRDLTQKTAKLEAIRGLKSVFDSNLKVVDQVLSSEQKVPEVLTVVDHIARSVGLDVERLSYSLSSSVQPESGHSMVDVSLSVSGTSDQLIYFFETLENASRLIKVTSYRYSKEKDSNSNSMSLVLQSPYLTVNSVAVTDEPISLDINAASFAKFITKVKGMTYYDPASLSPVEVVETQPETPTEDTDNLPVAVE